MTKATTESKTIAEKQDQYVTKISKQVTFMLCGSCFWSASYLDGKTTDRCPSCQSVNVEPTPVAGNEAHIFDYGSNRGVTVDFVPIRRDDNAAF